RHGDADALAARHERAAALAHGPASEEALHWAEVRADLAMLAGDAARSCRTWLAVARARLGAGQPADGPRVEAAVDRAHHQWGRAGGGGRWGVCGAGWRGCRRCRSRAEGPGGASDPSLRAIRGAMMVCYG